MFKSATAEIKHCFISVLFHLCGLLGLFPIHPSGGLLSSNLDGSRFCRLGIQGPPRLCTVYLGPFIYVADLRSRRWLRFSCSDCLVQPPVHRSNVDSRTFTVAVHQVWNCLPWRLRRRHLWQPSALDSRLFCSLSHISTLGLSDTFVSTHCL